MTDAPAVFKPAATALAPMITNPLVSNGKTPPQRDLNTWYARMLPIPYASLVTSGTGMGTFSPYGSMRGNKTAVPGCYDGISEFDPGEWVWGGDDTLLASSYALLATPACMVGGGIPAAAFYEASSTAKGEAMSQVGSLKIPDFNPSSLGAECDRPRAPNEGLVRNFQGGADAIDPSKMCMGSLGPLLPRSGKITGTDRYRTAEIAAIKFMSMLGDSTGNFQFHLQGEDKFQLIYPKSTMPTCFNPGGIIEFSRYLAMEERTAGQDVYVFAVWRRNDTCLNPYTYNQATIKLDLEAKVQLKRGVCSAGLLGK